MATFETTLAVDASVEQTFAFVSDFTNAVSWDPRSYTARKTTEGPIGVGTRFVITGGMLPRRRVERFRIPLGLAGMSLPYDVLEFDPPHRFVLEGRSLLLRYRDDLVFEPDGEGTLLRYAAVLEARWLPRLWDPMIRPLFRRIGVAATRDLPAAVAEGSRPTR